MDFLIRNTKVIDGSGTPAFKGDVGISGTRICQIGNLSGVSAPTEIDGEGLVVAPGFIDIHSHSDFTLLINPQAESKIRQGVTTEVIGNCGLSPAPLDKESGESFQNTTTQLSPFWASFGEFLAQLDQAIAVNVIPLVGHGTLRVGSMGMSNRPPTGAEMADMQEALERALDEGAWGMSSGLIYPPGCYASTEELVALCRVAAGKNGFYFSHIRGEDERQLGSIREAVSIGERAGLPVQIAHFKSVRKANWSNLPQALELLERARDRGVDVMADRYPYTAASNGLADQLPNWAHEGGARKLLERLNDRSVRRRLLADLQAMQHPWPDVFITYSPNAPELEGKTVSQIAGERNREPDQVVLDILNETDLALNIVDFVMSEENLKTVLQHSAIMVGSDGSARAPYGPLAAGKEHPRSYGTFPRVLGKYCRQEKVLDLPQAVFKMTGMPADRLGLTDRGRLAEGMMADLVLLNPETVIDRATYTDPYQYPEGIAYVMVNGQLVVTPEGHTGRLPGRVLSH